ncbi:MAG: hypothetical protein ACUVXI_16380 [bacterium]
MFKSGVWLAILFALGLYSASFGIWGLVARKAINRSWQVITGADALRQNLLSLALGVIVILFTALRFFRRRGGNG